MSFDLPASDSATATGNMPVIEFEPEPTPYVEPTFDEPVYDVPADEPANTSPVVLTDAKSRSLRTLAQGAGMAALTAVVLVLYPVLQSGDVSHVDWRALALVCTQAVGTALFSYVQRVLGKGPSA